VADHHEKQKFLKALYENFYKAYNPKAADRLGVVYTPNEIVDFMVDSTNFLLEKHFRRQLWDKNVEILDPATGTGTFICSIIDKCPVQYLAHKYKKELHANDVAILPYYVANLNIEYTFKQKMGYYEEFPNICFVDTLDNVGALKGVRKDIGIQTSMFGFSSENSNRIKRQNEKKISVVIGNPPYNANQKNENENNKNREYPAIDRHIKDTFVKHSTAQKTKVYDMYARFYRWAMDRIDANGIIAFITNRSFIDSRTFDGFRKCVEQDFAHCYIIDTQSDVRANPKIAGTTHNVFGIQTGVAVMFLVKSDKQKEPCRIEYTSLPDEWRKEEKWYWFRDSRIEKLEFQNIIPDQNHNWINLADNDFEELLPLANKDVKLGRKKEALFQLYSLGVVTARDEWVYDEDASNIEKKVNFLIDAYNLDVTSLKGKTKDEIRESIDYSIKWTRAVKNDLSKGIIYSFDKSKIIDSLYRPFVKRKLYFSRELNEMQYQLPNMFQDNNLLICINHTSTKQFNVIATDTLPDYHLNGDAVCISLFNSSAKSSKTTNITDWGLQQYNNHYQDESISKEDIFHYVYAVLHNPAYRKKYELNLKREFPRIPFYKDFWQWAAWGKELMDLHIGYETVEPYPLKEHNYEVKAEAKRQKEMFTVVQEPEPMFGIKPKVKVKLKADKQAGIIEIDELTFLSGIPNSAWEYKLGNRSALEWILDQYKEKKPKDPTIAEKFNTYRFADYKEKVIDLLKRVCTVSLETVRIVDEMENMK
jgi:predicted helicase